MKSQINKFKINAFALFTLCLLITPKAFTHISGGGTATNPYLIGSVANYQTFQGYVNANNTNFIDVDKHWKLTTDLNLASITDPKIGKLEAKFKGVFDGDGHTISFNSIGNSTMENVGLFGYTTRATIRNLEVIGNNVEGTASVGGLIGCAEYETTIENVHVKINNNLTCHSRYCGGLIAYLSVGLGETAYIKDCSVTGTATLGNSVYPRGAGGLIGVIYNLTSSTSSSQVIISDCLADVNFIIIGTWTDVGGVLGEIITSGIDSHLIRCFTTAKVPNIGGSGLARGSIIGSVPATSTCTGTCVHNSGSGGVQIGQGVFSNPGGQRRTDWDTGPYVYDDLERRNDDGTVINSTTRKNERWGYGTALCPKLTKTEYAVITRRGSNISAITGHQYLSTTNYFTNANKTLTISTTLNPSTHQRVNYTFSPEYDHSLGAAHNYSATLSGTNWLFVPRVTGTVNATLINVPYPISENVIFDQWNKRVTVSWNYNNSGNIAGKFYVYRHETGNSTWTNLTTSGITVTNGSGISESYEDNTIDYGKNYEYCIGFIEDVNPTPPTNPDDIRAADRVKKTVATTPSITYTATATGGGATITVGLANVDERLTGTGCTYEIQKSTNGGSYVSWIVPKTMTGAESYTEVDNEVSNSCNEYKYKVIIKAFANQEFPKETNNARTTATLQFVDDNQTPFKCSKGEYTDYVRLGWKMNKTPGSDMETYRVFRRVANSNSSWLELETVTSGAATIYWNDNTAVAGIYYEYKVTAYQICSGTETELQSKTDIGFTVAFGTVSGRVTYGSGSSVEDVKMLVKKNELQPGETQYRSLKSNGNSSAKFEWLAEQNYFNSIWVSQQWTLQFWVNPDGNNTGKINMGYFGSNWFALSKVTGGYKLDFFNAALASEIIPVNHFTHITITRNGNDVKIYTILDSNLDDISIHNTSYTHTTATALSAADCKISLGHQLSGNIDDVRFWNRPLSETEIMKDYNRYLVGNENGLVGYWTLDEGLEGYAFDMSRVGSVYNGNHATTNTLASSVLIPDEQHQLGLKGFTDTNGNYQINGIPFTGTGTSYSIVPSLGIHTFNPTEQLRYFAPSAMVHNSVDFIDNSSFPVSGTITYEGGAYPVADCSFEIDGKTQTLPNGQMITSDANGNFSLNVPIGVHEVRVLKQGHTFANDGYLKDENTGLDLNYNSALSNIKFYDQTRVKLIGRVVGGKTEDDKPLGFGESKNNIGFQTIKLETTKNQYDFINTPLTGVEFSHNQGQWKKPDGLQDDYTTVDYNQKDITVHASPITGEFVAMVYPEPYNIANITVPAAGGTQLTVYNNNEMIDLTDAAVPSEQYLQFSVRTWADSIFVPYSPGVLEHWESFEVSDTVRYNDSWTRYYQSTPTFTLQQVVDSVTVDYFGNEVFYYDDMITNFKDTIELYDKNTKTYLFGKPVFTQGTVYTFGLQAYEKYTNYVSGTPETVTYPVKDGKVSMSNDIRMNPKPETIAMDSTGVAIYQFLAGAPNLTTGKNNFFATLKLGTSNISYNWDILVNGSVNTPVEAFHLGAKSTGTNFLTHGPDRVDFILRDPPGSGSKSFLEDGTTTVTKWTHSNSFGASLAMDFTFHLGQKITTWVGIGAGIITETEVKKDISIGFSTEEKYSYNHEKTKTTVTTERIETSEDPYYIGASGDVFVGNSSNILYGLTNNVAIMKNEEVAADDTPFATESVYSIAPAASLAFGEVFDTRFAYTQRSLEEVMIPGWRNALNLLLYPVGTMVNTATITRPVYVSNLQHNDPNFGKLNTDKDAFGALASSYDSPENGPSYTIYFPDDYDMADFRTDSVMYYNNQVNGWISLLVQNEREKVQMKNVKNYSFSVGTTIEYSEKHDTLTLNGHKFNWMLNFPFKDSYGVEFNKFGLDWDTKIEVLNSGEEAWENSTTTSIGTGFKLSTGYFSEMISVDYGMTESGTFAFRTRGGQTACPYEGGYISKYFEPGMHVLDEATMRIEVPKIQVTSAPHLINVPANKEANFTLSLQNESEVGEDAWLEVVVDEDTNPNGAILKMDGLPIGNGRLFHVKFGQPLVKTLAVGKGTVDNYENIGIILRSQCEIFLADTVWISVDFVPACTEVAITKPSNNWILNADNPTGDTLYVSIADYDVNFPNFGYIKLEQRLTSSPTWSTIMTFYPSHLYENAQGIKEDIGNSAIIEYPWKMPSIDGAYELRATAASVNIVDGFIIGDPLSTFSTNAVVGYKDITRPTSLGLPSPANGILGIGDELSITFNEDIQTGMLTQNNFTISGVLNELEIEEPNVGLAFSGTQSAQTELPIFTSGSFSIETMFNREDNTSGTLFAFGSNNNYISLGFNAAGNAVLTIGNETYTSSNAIENDNTWKYVAMVYNRDANSVSVLKFEGSSNDYYMLTDKPLIVSPETQGALIVGNNETGTNGFHGTVAQLHFYGVNRLEAEISAGKSSIKSGREYGLIGYWLLDEGEGAIAKDKARFRHLSLFCDWYIYPSGYAKQTNNTYISIPTYSYPLNAFCDFTLEFWFRSEGFNQENQILFSCDNGSIGVTTNDTLKLYNAAGDVVKILTTNSLMDTKWHHFAMSVRRNGNVNVYIDGENKATFAETLLGSYGSGFYYFGAKYTPSNTYSDYFAGYFDEIRIWNSALNRDNILLNKNSKLRGDEAGLKAYYPFEEYITQGSGIITVIPSDDNMVDNGYTTSSGTATSSTVSVAVKDVRPVENVPFTYVSSINKIVFTLDNSYFARVEGTTLNITVKDVYDMHNNKSNTEQWTAYVKRNPLQWDTDPVYMKMQEGDVKTFTAKIINVGATSLSYNIENLPSWLSVNSNIGNLAPLTSKELTFTVVQGVNIGNYETGIGLTCGNGVVEILPVQLKVTGAHPDWNVDPYGFEMMMNIIGQIKIDGNFQEDPDDMLGAFIGNLCVGVASPTQISSYNAYFIFANIYGNSVHLNQPITFKLWDASTGRIYPVVETSEGEIVFTHDMTIGTLTNPVIFNALDIAEQVIVLNNGWNWISANVLNDNPTIIEQMKTALEDVGEIIKGRNDFIQQPDWMGTLTEISEKEMYSVKTNALHTLVLNGQYAKCTTSPIPINNGWNGIGYIPAFTLPVNDALASLDAQIGDQIKGQLGFATYSGSANGWIGNLNYMQQGKGYMYLSNNTAQQTLIYPSHRGGLGSPEQPPVFDPENFDENSKMLVDPIWIPDFTQYSNTMTMTSVVVFEGIELHSDLIEIGAFNGNECRGSAILQYQNTLDRYLGFMMIYGNGNESITLKIYDHEIDTEYDADNAPIIFVSDAIYGNPLAPYIIAVGEAPKSDDASLSNLTVSEGELTPEFNSALYDYTVDVGYNITNITIAATSTDANATVTGDGQKTLITGENFFEIKVIAEDGTTILTYTVTVHRALNNNVATLFNLTVSVGTLTPAFNSALYDYTVDVAYNITNITLTATSTDVNATVVGDGLKYLNTGVNPFNITVTAQDGITTQTYTVTVNRGNNSDATLSVLSVSAGTLTPMFSSNIYNYTVNVPYNISSITIAATPTDANATVTGDGQKTLITGENFFEIKVTAEDGTTMLTYTVTVHRAYNTDATLSNLTVSVGELNPVFGSNTYNYTVMVPFEETEIDITATPTDPNAMVLGDGLKILDSNVNTFTIFVIAADGVTTLEYKITVNCMLDIVETHCNASLQIYPNPTRGEVVVSTEYRVQSIEIFDLLGKMVFIVETWRAASLQSEIVFDISSLPAGIYFIRIQTENGMVTRKVVKN
jgi:hypothetical protein